jgi:site-specific recombinase XerC
MSPMTVAIQDCRAYLQRRHDSAATLDSDTLDLQLCFADIDKAPDHVACGAIARCIDRPYQQGLAPATINRRLSALKHVFDCLLERQVVSGNPIQPSHVLRRARTLPHPLDRALFLLMRRCGLRVSAVARLKRRDIDWAQQAVLVKQGKGRKDRRVSLSADAIASLRECLQQRPRGVPAEAVFWNQKRPHHPLSVKAIQKKMARDAKAAGMVASCHRLRQSLCLQPARARRGDGLHSGAARACLDRLQRAVCKGLKPESHTGLCENHAESHAAEPRLRGLVPPESHSAHAVR